MKQKNEMTEKVKLLIGHVESTQNKGFQLNNNLYSVIENIYILEVLKQ